MDGNPYTKINCISSHQEMLLLENVNLQTDLFLEKISL